MIFAIMPSAAWYHLSQAALDTIATKIKK